MVIAELSVTSVSGIILSGFMSALGVFHWWQPLQTFVVWLLFDFGLFVCLFVCLFLVVFVSCRPCIFFAASVVNSIYGMFKVWVRSFKPMYGTRTLARIASSL